MYPEDLKMGFMGSNLVSGMIQRLDKLRKTAFGSILIFSKDGKFTIEGVWVVRGDKLAFDVSELLLFTIFLAFYLCTLYSDYY